MNPVDEITVLRLDLEAFRAMLNTAYNFSMTLDLTDQYRKLSGRAQWSAMTKGLEASVEKLDIYLAEEEENEDG